MSRNQITRRSILRSAAAGAALSLWDLRKLAAARESSPPSVKILDPFHGAVLNHRHGRQNADTLTIRISGEARPGDRVTVNGKVCRRDGIHGDAIVEPVPRARIAADLPAVGGRRLCGVLRGACGRATQRTGGHGGSKHCSLTYEYTS